MFGSISFGNYVNSAVRTKLAMDQGSTTNLRAPGLFSRAPFSGSSARPGRLPMVTIEIWAGKGGKEHPKKLE